jgi:hypothetical protein
VLEVATICVFIGVRIIKEMPGSVASGTHCINDARSYERQKWMKLISLCPTFLPTIVSKNGSPIFLFHSEFHIKGTKSKVKGKGFPPQAEVAQGVPGRLWSRIFLTFRHYKGGRSSAKRTGRLYPRRNPWYLLSEAESISGHMFLSGVPRKKSPVTPPGIDPGTVRLVA